MNIKLKWLIVGLFYSLFLGVTACGFNLDDDDDSQAEVIVVAPEPPAQVDTTINIFVIDVETGEIVDIQTSLQVAGDNAPDIVSPDGSALQFSSANGVYLLTVSQLSVNSIQASFAVTAEGYFSINTISSIAIGEVNTVNINITPKTIESETVSIELVTNEVPVVADDTGQTALNIELETSVEEVDPVIAGSSVEVIVPQSSVLLDANEEPVTGQITASMVYYPNDPELAAFDETSPMTYFPGGLDVVTNDLSEPASITSIRSPTAVSSLGSFISAGVIIIELLNELGVSVEQISGEELDFVFNVSAKTIDPTTSQAIQTGGQVPVWRYDLSSSIWIQQANLTIGDYDEVSDTFLVAFTAEQPGYWSLGFFSPFSSACESVDFDILDANGEPNQTPINFAVARPGGGWLKFFDYTYYLPVFGSYASGAIENFPDVPIRIRFVDNERNPLLEGIYSNGVKDESFIVGSNGAVEFDSLCDLNGKSIGLTSENQAETTIDVAVTTQYVCTNDTSQTTSVPATIYLFEGDRFVATLQSPGTALSLLPGTEYAANITVIDAAQAGGQVTQTVSFVASESVTLSVDVSCETITGGGNL